MRASATRAGSRPSPQRLATPGGQHRVDAGRPQMSSCTSVTAPATAARTGGRRARRCGRCGRLLVDEDGSSTGFSMPASRRAMAAPLAPVTNTVWPGAIDIEHVPQHRSLATGCCCRARSAGPRRDRRAATVWRRRGRHRGLPGAAGHHHGGVGSAISAARGSRARRRSRRRRARGRAASARRVDGVDHRGALVADQQRRAADQRRRDRETLQLAARTTGRSPRRGRARGPPGAGRARDRSGVMSCTPQARSSPTASPIMRNNVLSFQK